jgi:putative phage-type endonuclease
MRIRNDIKSGTAEWLEWRKSGIGASDIAAICGVCPYKTALDIYNDKKGLSKDRRNSAMQRGIDFEDEARKIFIRDRENKDWFPLNVERPGTPEFKASLDGYNPFTNCILEIKVPNRKVLDMARYGQLPIHYLYQVQWQLFVTGCPKAYYFCYNPDTFESYTVEVYPDQEIIDVIYIKAVNFWFNTTLDVPPEPKPSKKVACGKATMLLQQMLDCKEKEKEATERYKSLLAELMAIEGVEDGIESDSATLSVSERSSYDYKKAAEDAGVDLEQYKKPTTKVWVIRAKAVI